MSAEPEVPVPMPAKYGAPYCPFCGYKCGCCCICECQTECNNLESYGDEEYCDCSPACHGGHEPWDCGNWATRYRWAKDKSEQLAKEEM